MPSVQASLKQTDRMLGQLAHHGATIDTQHLVLPRSNIRITNSHLRCESTTSHVAFGVRDKSAAELIDLRLSRSQSYRKPQ